MGRANKKADAPAKETSAFENQATAGTLSNSPEAHSERDFERESRHTLDAVRAVLVQVQRIAGKNAAVAILKAHGGVDTLEKLGAHPERFPAVLTAANDRLAGLPASDDQTLARITYAPRCGLFKLPEVLQALNKHGRRLGMYVFANQIVEASQTVAKGFDGREADVFELVAFNEDAFAANLGQRIVFGKEVEGGIKQEPCPTDLRSAIFGSTHKLPDITIRRVAQTPIWRSGTLHAARGFDPVEHVWIEAPEVTLPARCDQAAALSAREYVLSWLNEFPFASELDREVALAGILTAAMRASVRSPGIVITKPSHGAGASTLTDLIHIVLTGRTAPVTNASKAQAEIDKEADAAAAAGRASLVLDNIPAGGGFNSIAVAQTVTQETRQIRILGQTKSPTVECQQLVILNGVNVRLADDLGRRFIACELDPQMERPENRAFARPTLLQDARLERVRILEASYTIVAAYERSGQRVHVKPIAGFSEWQRLVQEALVWTGGADVALSQDVIKADDPASAQLRTLFEVWPVLFGDAPVTAAEVVQQANPSIADEADMIPEQAAKRTAAREELRGARQEAAGWDPLREKQIP